MVSTLGMTSLVLMTLLSTPSVLCCNRYRYYGEPCIGLGYEQGQGKDVCDSRRLLTCDYRTGTCQCPDFYYHFFDNYNARCYKKIGTACQDSFGGLSESWYNHGCPDNSFCSPGSGYCKCKPLFRQNYEGTGCFNGSPTITGAIFLPILILSKLLL